jgi:hypothetical protein
MKVFNKEYFCEIWEYLDACKDVEMREDYHPEKNVYSHSLQCVKWAFRETIDTEIIIAALTHDIGKLISPYGHPEYTIKLIGPHLSIKSEWLILNHMRIRDFIDGRMRKLGKVKALMENPWFEDLVLLTRIDKLGRNPNINKFMRLDEIVDRLNNCVDLHFQRNKERGIL